MIKKICILGASGKTGSKILKYFLQNKIPGYDLVHCITSPNNENLNKSVYSFLNIENQENQNDIIFSSNIELAILDSDIIIDFSTKDITQNIFEIYFQKYNFKNKIFIIGTTPFEKLLIKNFDKFIENNIVFYSENMSFLINIVSIFLKKFSSFLCKNYDISIHETHHIHKKDNISGTANMLKNSILSSIDSLLVKNINISSSRISEIFGIHDVFFANQFESLKISHNIIDRDIFAFNVFKIVNWIIDLKKKNGYFKIDDLLNEYIFL
jgi:4-hydroxy-tetrahydrodipicolinate reductase